MHISWHGLSCIKIQTADATMLINPFQNSVGVSMPKFKVNVVLSSNPSDEQSNNTDSLQGEPFYISTAGEYEANGMFVTGVQYDAENTLYIIEAEGMTLAHLGTTARALTDAQLEALEGVDVLFLPLTCAEGTSCSRLVSQIEPRVIIPIQYKTPKFKGDLATFDAFAKDMGVKDTAGEDKIIIKAKDLPVEETRIQILNVA